MSLARVAIHGIAWQGLAVVIAKLSSFLSLIILGWALSKEDFAVYASSWALASIFVGLKNGAIDKFLVQKGLTYYQINISGLRSYAHLFNLAISLLVMSSGYVASRFLGDEVLLVFAIVALSSLLNGLPLPYTTRLSIDHRFKEFSLVESVSAMVRHGLCVLFALAGFGAESFVLPMLVLPLIEWWMARKYAGKLELDDQGFSFGFIVKIFQHTKWILFAALATILIMQGDYLVISYLKDETLLANYFFGFQLTMAVSVLLSAGFQSVLMPVFASMKNDISRLARAYQRAISVTLFAMGFISALGICLMEIVIHELWQGKWDEATIVSQFMLFSLITRIVSPLSRSLLQARGEWGDVALILCLDAILTILVTLIACGFAGLYGIALSVAVFRFVFGLGIVLYVCRYISLPLSAILYKVMATMLGVACFIVAYDFLVTSLAGLYSLLLHGIAGSLSALLYFVLVWLINKPLANEVIAIFIRRKGLGEN